MLLIGADIFWLTLPRILHVTIEQYSKTIPQQSGYVLGRRMYTVT